MTPPIGPGRIRYFDSSGDWAVATLPQAYSHELNRFAGWTCAAGTESLFIDADGRVFVAVCRNGGPLGTIQDGFTLPASWTTCRTPVCFCGPNIGLTKHRGVPAEGLPVGREVSLDALGEPSAVAGGRRDFLVNWDLSRRCNFACSYCDPDWHNKSDPHKPLNLLIRTVDRIMDAVPDREVSFTFTGGEPTLHPDYLTLCRHIRTRGGRAQTCTNGSRSGNYLRELVRLSDVFVSVHNEFMKPEKLCRVVRDLMEERRTNPASGWVTIKFFVRPGQSAPARALGEIVRAQTDAALATVAFYPLRNPDHTLMTYSLEELEFFRNPWD